MPHLAGRRRASRRSDSASHGFGDNAFSTTSSSSFGTSGWRRSAPRRRDARSSGGQHLVENGADRIDVGAVVGRLAARLFRRVVVVQAAPRRPPDRSPLATPDETSESWRDLSTVIITESGLSPPCTKPAACASATASVIWMAISSARRAFIGRPRHLRTKRLPPQELERDEDAVVVLAGIEERDDVRMRQRDQRPRLSVSQRAPSDALA